MVPKLKLKNKIKILLFSLVSASRLNRENTRQLTRLHVHTLAYQAILTVKNSPWRNSKAAAAKASLTANRHVCGTKEVSLLWKLP
jgi:ADP-dependent glucokinase